MPDIGFVTFYIVSCDHLVYLVLGQVLGQLVHLPPGHITVLIFIVQLESHLRLVQFVNCRRLLGNPSKNILRTFPINFTSILLFGQLCQFLLILDLLAGHWANNAGAGTELAKLSQVQVARLVSICAEECSSHLCRCPADVGSLGNRS